MSRYAGLLGRRRRAHLSAIVVLLSAGYLAGAPAPAAASGCPHASAEPGAATTSQLRKATLCLINRARASAEVDPLTLDTDLTTMAKHHTKRMLAQNCLKHQCAGELTLTKRLKASGYLDGATKWVYAEDLGYESTPKRMVNRWLDTTADQANLLNQDYVDVGIGPGRGAASAGVNDPPFVTYTIDLASRTPPN